MPTFNPFGSQSYTLAASISSTQTTILLSSFLEPVSGVPYTMALINSSIAFGTIGPKTSASEFISFTGITQNSDGTALLTGVTRGLAKKYPFTASSTFQIPHSGGSSFIISNAPQLFNEYAVISNDVFITGAWTINDPTTSLGIANKHYVDTIAIQGSPTASTSLPGISMEATQADTDAGTGSRTYNGNPFELFVNPAKLKSTLNTSGITIATYTTGESVTANLPGYVGVDGKAYISRGYKQGTNIAIAHDIPIASSGPTTGGLIPLSSTQVAVLTFTTGAGPVSSLYVDIYDVTTGSLVASGNTSNALETFSVGGIKIDGSHFILFNNINAGGGLANLNYYVCTVSGSSVSFSSVATFDTGIDATAAIPIFSNDYFTTGKGFITSVKSGNAITKYVTCTVSSITTNSSVSVGQATGFGKGFQLANGTYMVYQFGSSGSGFTIHYLRPDGTSGSFSEGPFTLGATTLNGVTFPMRAIGNNGIIPIQVRVALGSGLGSSASLNKIVFGENAFSTTADYQGYTTSTLTTGLVFESFFASLYSGIAKGSDLAQNGYNVFTKNGTYQKDSIPVDLFNNGTGIGTEVFTNTNYYLTDTTLVCFLSIAGTRYLVYYQMPTGVDGFFTESVASGSSATLSKGQATGSFTSGREYYLKDSWTNPGDMDTSGIVKVGDATSTSIIQFNPLPDLI